MEGPLVIYLEWSKRFTASDSVATGLDIGVYDITVIDTNGCVFSLNPQIISQPLDYLAGSFVMVL